MSCQRVRRGGGSSALSTKVIARRTVTHEFVAHYEAETVANGILTSAEEFRTPSLQQTTYLYKLIASV